LVLCALTAGTAYVYYLAVDADDAIPPAAADVAPPRVVTAPGRISGPIYAIPDDATKKAAAAVPSARSSAIARDIQTALVNARCYDGPVTGNWTPASQAAMRTFLRTVKAELPVGSPDPALLTLLTAHADATCDPVPGFVRGSLETQDARPTASEASRLDHAWAPAGMLIPPQEMTTSERPADNAAAAPPATPTIVPPVAAQAVVPETPQSSPAAVSANSSASNSKLKFEDETVVAAREAASDPAETRPQPARKVSQRKARTAKRRASRQSEQTFGMNFDSIQRSISSLFE
jgi:hypothetical protein